MEHLSFKVEHNNSDKEKDRIEWRRSKIQELTSKGHSQREIAQVLQVSNGTVNRDLSILRQQAKTNIKRYIDERLPEEYEKCLVGLNAITKEAWSTAQNTEDKREKIQALSLAKECYSMKLELLTNATVVDDAIRFVSRKSKEKGESTHSSNEDDKEAREPDYDEDKDQLDLARNVWHYDISHEHNYDACLHQYPEQGWYFFIQFVN
jgi:predicted transcriptional regulator